MIFGAVLLAVSMTIYLYIYCKVLLCVYFRSEETPAIIQSEDTLFKDKVDEFFAAVDNNEAQAIYDLFA